LRGFRFFRKKEKKYISKRILIVKIYIVYKIIVPIKLESDKKKIEFQKEKRQSSSLSFIIDSTFIFGINTLGKKGSENDYRESGCLSI